jgi:hypothetical protein
MKTMDKSFGTARKSIVTFSVLTLCFANLAYGQTSSSKDVNVVNTPSVNVINTPAVGIDPTKNTVRLTNTESDPLAVTVVGGAARRPFQARVNLQIPAGANFDSATLAIPAGKRLVIEDVSALTFQPQGQGLLINFNTSVEDSVGSNNTGGFENHDVVLVSQGIFNELERSASHQTMLVFADESVETPVGVLHGLGVVVSLSRGTLTGSAGARVTFSGYVEDLPATALSR